MGFPSLIRKLRPDVVIASYDPRFLTNLVGYYAARKLGIKWIWWGHGIRPRDRYHFIYRKMAKMADAVVLYSGHAADKMALIGVPREKIFVAWNAIDTAEIEEYYRAVPFEQRFRILYIGRLIRGKKVDLLIQGFAAALPRLPDDTKLSIIGNGNEERKLKSLVSELRIESNVEFSGKLTSQDQLAPYFNSSFVSVSPGQIGLSAIHSLAYRVPLLVANKEPHGPEITILEEDKNGCYFATNSVNDLARHLIELSDNRARCELMGERGQQSIHNRFNIETMVNSFLDAIKYVLK
jgi:glycosyltransferase involved in cell wall biosynthesis